MKLIKIILEVIYVSAVAGILAGTFGFSPLEEVRTELLIIAWVFFMTRFILGKLEKRKTIREN
ncbi:MULTISPECIES: hypothetical protein [Pontibacillus]|uniref:DUF1328 domain-containing protein n=1 Tax=Pontibacillus chungwhensis TaxID=265426 RepID=A0ABY8V0U2_9BACI|nr:MULTISPECIES: hypothetical protein [Pontibacillus]MCD5324337.1 hypothetical protein [Pontibacillus sp. HN14]WIF99364.1 hypothetical protein QNI29_06820 [Pontibacillus chungwhensis]